MAYTAFDRSVEAAHLVDLGMVRMVLVFTVVEILTDCGVIKLRYTWP